MKESICKTCEYSTVCNAGRDSLNGSKVKILGCSRYEKKPVKTNADRIRAMTDEELAEWLEEQSENAYNSERPLTALGWLDWLKQEVKE